MRLLDITKILIISIVQVIKKCTLISRKNSNGYYNSDKQLFLVKLIGKNGKIKFICPSLLKKGDIVEISAGEIIPSDGEIIEGYATVDESAITGESAFVLREEGGDLSKVIGGTKVISNTIKIKITSSVNLIMKEGYAEDSQITSKVKHINFGV